MPNFPKVICIERMIPTLLQLAHKWRQPLDQALNILKGLHRRCHANHSSRLTQVEGLLNVLYGYILALFIIG